MRIYRYLFFVLLFAVGIWLTSIETVLNWQQISRDSYPNLTVRLTEENRDEITDMLGTLSRKHNVSVFIGSYEADRNDNVYNTYYADAEAHRILEKEWHYGERTVRNSVSGRYLYHFRLASLEDAKELLYEHTAAFIGSDDDIRALGADISEYAAAHFEAGTVSKLNLEAADIKGITGKRLFYLWLGVIAVLSVMTAMETSVFRKEAVILLTNGSSLISVIAGRLLTDLAVCSVLLALLSGVLVGIGFPAYSLVYAVTALGALMLCSTLIYSTLIFSNTRAALGGARQGSRILVMNCFFKAAAVACCVVLSLSAADIISRNKVGSDTEELIRTYFDGYVYADITNAALMSRQEDSEAIILQKDIYHDHYYDMEPVRFSVGILESNHEQIEANHYAVGYLRSQIPEMSEYDESSVVTLIVRRGSDYVDIGQMEGFVREKLSTEKFGDVELKIIYYSDPLELMYIGADTATGISYISDPVIVLYNTTPELLDEIGWHGHSITALKLSDENIDALCTQYGIRREDLKPVSVLERYESHWKVIKASILSQIMLAVMTGAVVLLIGITIVKYTFIAHAKELCIKKILGHSLLRRYVWVFVINAVICILGFAAAYFIAWRFRFYINWNFGLALAVTVGLFIADIILTVPRIIKQEQTSAQKVLKGGAL